MPSEFTVFFLVEIVGTITFALSGGMVAIRKNLDLLGIIVLGVVTATGGGMMRDIFIGVHPPTLFTKPIYVYIAFFSVLVLFFVVKYSSITMEMLESEAYERIINLFDAIGLGAFTVVGIDTAILAGLDDYGFLLVVLGVITGVGGGLLRDMMAGITPAVLRKHVYACASIVGAVLYVLMLDKVNKDVRLIVSATVVVMIRLLARKYKWNLPKAM